jgi:hypothetical protein
MASKHLDDIRFGGSDDARLSSSACPINVSLGAEVGASASIPCLRPFGTPSFDGGTALVTMDKKGSNEYCEATMGL